MKYVILSFDDGRKDFWLRALPILQKHGLSATLNIIPDFVGRSGIEGFYSGNGEFMSWSEIEDCAGMGIEIANHSADHTNAIEQIFRGSAEIHDRLTMATVPGFASPNSEISENNFEQYRDLLLSGAVKYIRSGNQLRRDGYGNIILWMLYKYTKSPIFFYLYNRRNILVTGKKQKPSVCLPSVTCNRDNTIQQLIHFIDKMPDNSGAILMFHSILNDNDPGFGKDKWFNTCCEFEQLCAFLSNNEQVQVVTNEQLCEMML